MKSSLKMKLDDQGEAFFVRETSVRPSEVDDDLMATSPIVSPLTSPVRTSSPSRVGTMPNIRKEEDDDGTTFMPSLDLDSVSLAIKRRIFFLTDTFDL
jgi:phosphatidate phosphatase PAH1